MACIAQTCYASNIRPGLIVQQPKDAHVAPNQVKGVLVVGRYDVNSVHTLHGILCYISLENPMIVVLWHANGGDLQVKPICKQDIGTACLFVETSRGLPSSAPVNACLDQHKRSVNRTHAAEFCLPPISNRRHISTRKILLSGIQVGTTHLEGNKMSNQCQRFGIDCS